MKHAKLALYAAVTLAGVTTALFTKAKPRFRYMYYAVANGLGTHFTWTANLPGNKSCKVYTSISTAYCTITTNFAKPVAGTFPPLFNHGTDQDLYQ